MMKMDDGRSVEKIRISLKYRYRDIRLATMRENTNSTLMRDEKDENGQFVNIGNEDSVSIIEYDESLHGQG